jgi:translocator protein
MANNYKILTYIFLILQPIVLSAIISAAGNNYGKGSRIWYNSLNKSKATPPAIVFPIVWSILYILLGVSSFLIYQKTKNINSLSLFEAQLFFNLLWPILFFTYKKPVWALVNIIILLVITGFMLYQFFMIKPLAFYLLIPYAIWLIYATYLNIVIVAKNK